MAFKTSPHVNVGRNGSKSRVKGSSSRSRIAPIAVGKSDKSFKAKKDLLNAIAKDEAKADFRARMDSLGTSEHKYHRSRNGDADIADSIARRAEARRNGEIDIDWDNLSPRMKKKLMKRFGSN